MNKKLGEFINVSNYPGKNGPVRNQFLIHTSKGEVFQSYDTIVAARVRWDDPTDKLCPYGRTFLDAKYWDYSVTTGKYRNQFLNETKAETERKIRSGEYVLEDLNA